MPSSLPPRPSFPSPERRASQSPPEPEAPQISRLMRFGSAVGAALVASALASGPAAMRVSSTIDARGIWPALAAIALLPMLAAVLTLRQARVGLRAFAMGNTRKRGWSLAIWMCALFFFLLAWGAVLRAKTHHHPLAGATFALCAGAVAIVLLPISLRLGGIVARWQDEGRHMAVILFAAMLLGGGVVMVALLAKVLPPSATFSPAVSANLVDVLAFAMAALLASRPEFEARRALAIFGPPAATVLFVFAVRYLVATPALGEAIATRAPAFGPAVSVRARGEAGAEPRAPR